MTSFLNKLRQLLRVKKEAATLASGTALVSQPGATVTAANIHRLTRLLSLTGVDEYSCEETYELLDEYVDLVDNKMEAAALMPIVKQHLDKCPRCRQAFADLLHALQSEL